MNKNRNSSLISIIFLPEVSEATSVSAVSLSEFLHTPFVFLSDITSCAGQQNIYTYKQSFAVPRLTAWRHFCGDSLSDAAW